MKLSRQEVLSLGDEVSGLSLPPDPGEAHVALKDKRRALMIRPEDVRAIAAMMAGRHGGHWSSYTLNRVQSDLAAERLELACDVERHAP